MTKPINDFSDARVGDKVTCRGHGYGEIRGIDFDLPFPIDVNFENGSNDVYTKTGTIEECGGITTLFKGHVEFPAPIPVKKKVKKTMYTNVYLNKELSECYRLDVYPNETIKDEDVIVGKNTKDWVATAEVKFEVEE